MLRAICTMLALIGVIAAGCAPVQRPQTLVGEARVTEASAEGAAVAVPVSLSNPRGVPLPIREARFTMRVDAADAAPFHVTQQLAATLPAEGGQTVTLRSAFAVADGASLEGAPYVIEGTIVYEPPGEIRRLLTDSGLPLPSVRFAGQGTLGEGPSASPSH